MLIGGGDPGVTGGIAIIQSHAFKAQKVELFRMPVTPYTVENKDGSTGNRKEMDFLALDNLFREIVRAYSEHPRKEFFVERPSAWGLSAFSAVPLCTSYGAVAQVAICHGFTVRFFEPREWKANLGIPSKSKKSVSLAMAKELYPEMFYNLDKASNDGLADALLIAECGRRALANKAGIK